MGFRRRQARRFFLRGRRLSHPLAKRVLLELRRAHELEELGKSLEAAVIFEQLARKAQGNNLPQFPQLLLQAGRSNLEGGEHDKGIGQIKTALNALVDSGRIERAARLMPGLRKLFREHGLEPKWQEIETSFQAVGVGARPLPSSGKVLPAKCPYCGATLIPEELDETSREAAICGYCGSYVLAGEGNP